MIMAKPSIYVVSAIGGNMWRESHVDPSLWESLTPGSGGYGLCQWTGDRRINLFQWMEAQGYAVSDGDGQIEFLIYEQDWIDTSSSPLHFNSLNEFLESTSTDIPALTETFMKCWERPGVPALQERIEFAQKAYSYLLDHGNNQVDWIIGNRYLSEAEGLNNMVRVWQKFNGSTPPHPGGGWRYGAAREIIRRLIIHR